MITKEMIRNKLLLGQIQFFSNGGSSLDCVFGDGHAIALNSPNNLNAEEFLMTTSTDCLTMLIFKALEYMRKNDDYPRLVKRYCDINDWFAKDSAKKGEGQPDVLRSLDIDIKALLCAVGYQGSPEQVNIVREYCTKPIFINRVRTACKTIVKDAIKQNQEAIEKIEDINASYLVLITDERTPFHPASNQLFHSLEEAKSFMKREKQRYISKFKEAGISIEAESDETSWALRGPENTIRCQYYCMEKG